MSEWYCFECDEEVEMDDVLGTYKGLEGETEAAVCPSCGEVYILEEAAIVAIDTENMIDAKGI